MSSVEYQGKSWKGLISCVKLLLGRRVLDASGAILGRIEEIRTEEER